MHSAKQGYSMEMFEDHHKATKSTSKDQEFMEEKKRTRRFSKTISLTMVDSRHCMDYKQMKKIAKLASDCAAGRTIRDKEFEMMNSYNDYFINRAYDAHLIDQHVKGYSLFFTLMYINYKCDWKNTIDNLNINKLFNLAHHT